MSDDLKERLQQIAAWPSGKLENHGFVRMRCIMAIARIAELEAQLKAAREALEFYRDAFQFVPRRTKTGIDLSIWKPKDVLLEDCGERARAALDPKPTAAGETP